MNERISYQRGRVRVVRREWLLRGKLSGRVSLCWNYVVEVWSQKSEWAPVLDRRNFFPARAIAMALSRIIGGQRYQTKVGGKS